MARQSKEQPPAKAGQNQGRFRPGKSGNPAGKKPGTRHKATLAIEALLEGEAEELTRKAIELAKAGDMAALKLCLDRLAPPRKGRTVSFKLPPVSTPDDVVAAIGAILQAVSAGDVTPDEAQAVAAILEIKRQAIATADLAHRVAELEARNGQPG